MGKTQKIMKNEIDSIKGMNKSLDLLKNGNFTEALNNFSELLKSNYSDSTIDSGIKCCKYWIPRVSKFEFMKDDSFKGKFIIDEWNKFESFISSLKNMQEKVVSNTMFHIFNLALQAFKKDLNENRIIDFETTLLIGITYKKIGDYRSSISYFQDFLMNDSHNSNAMALLADCYALIDEEKKSKILFREAFFNDALGIDINLLESHIINTITAKIEEFKIKKMGLLGDLSKEPIEKLILTLDVSSIDKEFVDEISAKVPENKGKTKLILKVIDKKNHFHVELFARGFQINVSKNLIFFLQQKQEQLKLINFDLVLPNKIT